MSERGAEVVVTTEAAAKREAAPAGAVVSKAAEREVVAKAVEVKAEATEMVAVEKAVDVMEVVARAVGVKAEATGAKREEERREFGDRTHDHQFGQRRCCSAA